jgi:DNA-binding response OmpR family regulator
MNDETPATILVAEDDPATQRFLADELTADGYELLVAESAADALRLLETKFPDLAILDVGLGDRSGLDVVRRVRQADRATSALDPGLPLLILSGRSAEVDRVRAFEWGADDFLAKPFSYPELRGRVVALLRRSERRVRTGRVRVGSLELDPESRSVRLGGEPVTLTQKEYALLRVLAAAPTRVHTKDELLRTVWGFRTRAATRTLDSHACRLRAKLGGGRFVLNVWGVGYRLIDDPGTRDGLGAAACRPSRSSCWPRWWPCGAFARCTSAHGAWRTRFAGR